MRLSLMFACSSYQTPIWLHWFRSPNRSLEIRNSKKWDAQSVRWRRGKSKRGAGVWHVLPWSRMAESVIWHAGLVLLPNSICHIYPPWTQKRANFNIEWLWVMYLPKNTGSMSLHEVNCSWWWLITSWILQQLSIRWGFWLCTWNETKKIEDTNVG